MSEYNFLVRDGEDICAVTLTDIQGELADDAREQLLAAYDEA